jgi:hypothetical protein
VVEALNEDGGGMTLAIRFDQPAITCENPPPFQMFLDGEWTFPDTGVIDTGDLILQFHTLFDEGTPWRITQSPSELTFVGGGNLAIPESGLSTPP